MGFEGQVGLIQEMPEARVPLVGKPARAAGRSSADIGAIGLPRETVFRQFGGGGPVTVKPSQSASRRFRVYSHGAAELVEDERRREAFLLQAQIGTVLGGQCG